MIDLEEIKKKKKPVDEDDENTDEDGENFIDKRKQNSFSADKKSNVFDELKDTIKDAASKLKGATEIFNNKKKQLRTLDRETGGVEADYDEASKKNDMDKDLWDLKEIGSKTTEEIPFESSQNESFIHDKKTKRGRRGKRKMGAMILNNNALPDKKLTFGEKIKQIRTMKKDRSFDVGYGQSGNDGGAMM